MITPLAQFNFSQSKRCAANVSFSRNSIATRISSLGTIVSSAINYYRLEYSPKSNECLGLKIEAAATNLILNSEIFSGVIGTTVATNTAIAPNNTLTADVITETVGLSAHYTTDNTINITSGLYYTFSVFVKDGSSANRYAYLRISPNSSARVCFDPRTNTFGPTAGSSTYLSVGSEELANGWFRVWVTILADITGTTIMRLQLSDNIIPANTYTGDGLSGLTAWGAQVEATIYPTSYIKTTGTSSTRLADNAIVSSGELALFWRTDAGSIIFKGDAMCTDTIDRYFFALSDGTANNYIALVLNTSEVYFTCVIAGVMQWRIALGNYTLGEQIAVATSWDTAELVITMNGLAAYIISIANLPIITQLELGSFLATGHINGHIAKLAYYPSSQSSYLQEWSRQH